MDMLGKNRNYNLNHKKNVHGRNDGNVGYRYELVSMF